MMIQKTERYLKGIKCLNTVSPGMGENAMNSIEDIAPFFKQYVVESFGDMFSRENSLSLQKRELVVVTALATLGHALPQLEFHIAAALNVGCSREEITEAIMTVSLYAGIPAALNALRVAAKIYEQIDAKKND